MHTIYVTGESLFAVAARELGSALQWINIARANDIADPFIVNLTNVIIPDFSPVFNDGVGPQ